MLWTPLSWWYIHWLKCIEVIVIENKNKKIFNNQTSFNSNQVWKFPNVHGEYTYTGWEKAEVQGPPRHSWGVQGGKSPQVKLILSILRTLLCPLRTGKLLFLGGFRSLYASQTHQHLGLYSSAPRDMLSCSTPFPVRPVFETTVRSVLLVLASMCGPCFDVWSLLRRVVLASTCGPCFDVWSFPETVSCWCSMSIHHHFHLWQQFSSLILPLLWTMSLRYTIVKTEVQSRSSYVQNLRK